MASMMMKRRMMRRLSEKGMSMMAGIPMSPEVRAHMMKMRKHKKMMQMGYGKG